MRFALEELVKLHGAVPVDRFRLRELESLARHFASIRKMDQDRKKKERTGPPLSARYVRKLMAAVRQCWNWLALRDAVPMDAAALVSKGVAALPAIGGPDRPATRPIKPEEFSAILPHLSPTVSAMARLQLLTGMRTGELLSLTADQIDRSALPWVYRPTRHKNAHRGKPRAVYLSAEAVEILRPFLEGPAFSIRLDSYHHAIRRAAEKAGVQGVRPYMLRHAAATEARIAHGDDFAQRILGHAGRGLLERYAGTAEEERRRRAG